MKNAALVSILLLAHSASAAVYSFEQILTRARRQHAISPTAETALEQMENPPGVHFPIVRIETSASSAQNVDVFARNVFRQEALSALLSVDYPLIDGGLRDKQLRVARLDAQSFRQRMRETSDHLFRETVEAVARLYTAQERLRILNEGLRRAVTLRERAQNMLAMQEISNVTAAQWHDEAIAAEAQLLDLDLQRLEAETHVKQLMGDTTNEPVEVVLTLDVEPPFRALALAANPDPLVSRDEGVTRATMEYERRRLAVEEAEAARRPQLMMSAFGGVAALGDVENDPDGRYALYGLRFTVALPMFDANAARRVAEARLQAEQADFERRTTTEQIRRQTSTMWLGIAALEKRITLLQQAIDVAARREESVIRLVAAGLRPENDVAEAAAERAKRESDALGARVELWKYQQILKHKTNTELIAARAKARSTAAGAAK